MVVVASRHLSTASQLRSEHLRCGNKLACLEHLQCRQSTFNLHLRKQPTPIQVANEICGVGRLLCGIAFMARNHDVPIRVVKPRLGQPHGRADSCPTEPAAGSRSMPHFRKQRGQVAAVGEEIKCLDVDGFCGFALRNDTVNLLWEEYANQVTSTGSFFDTNAAPFV